MLNIVPIQFLAPVAYALLRLCLGFLFLYFARSHVKNHEIPNKMFLFQRLPYKKSVVWYIVLIETVAGVLFVLGLFTQVAAFIGILYALKFISLQKNVSDLFIQNRAVYILILFVSLSLFITGAGAFAFDLPI